MGKAGEVQASGLVASTAAHWRIGGLLALCGALAWQVGQGQLTPPALLIPMLISVVLAPVLEETVFRLGLQESLLRRGWQPLVTALVVALAFALAHLLLRGPAWLNAATALPALALGLLYTRTRRLSDCVLAHAGCNAVWWLIGAALPLSTSTTGWSS